MFSDAQPDITTDQFQFDEILLRGTGNGLEFFYRNEEVRRKGGDNVSPPGYDGLVARVVRRHRGRRTGPDFDDLEKVSLTVAVSLGDQRVDAVDERFQLVEISLDGEQVETVEADRQRQLRGPQEIEDISEDLTVTVDEVAAVFVEGGGQRPVEHSPEHRVGKAKESRLGRRVVDASDV